MGAPAAMRSSDAEIQNALVAFLLDYIAHMVAGGQVADVAKHQGACAGRPEPLPEMPVASIHDQDGIEPCAGTSRHGDSLISADRRR